QSAIEISVSRGFMIALFGGSGGEACEEELTIIFIELSMKQN
ncbi:8349_t:CDS:1, partial [Rhizophagus irregularis]